MLQGRVSPGWKCALVLAVVLGCRGTRPPVIDHRAVGIIYDTANEEKLKSGKAPVLIQQTWGEYVDTLAEPAAIVGWRDGVSTWEIFFATNRGNLGPSSEARARFGNEVRTTPLYGRAEVTLPRRGRGVDPATSVKKNPLIPAAFSRQPEADEVVQFRDVGVQEPTQFLDGVNAQLARSRQKDLLIFVHGFNVDFDSSIIRAAQVALDVPFNGAVVAYAWPSQGGVKNYEADEPINATSVAPFAEFLQTLLDGVPPETRVSIMVHSMGNRIVMQGINRLTPESRLAHVVLCAPDVGLRDFREWSPGVVERSERVTLYASENDSALIMSKNVHVEQRAGDAHPPVICEGVETIDCSTIDYATLLGHSYYGANGQVLGDLFLLLKEGRPADRRPHLTAENGDGGRFWVFSGNAPNILVTWHFDEADEASK
jgi:esterase/lipase superfamily enzyme